MGAGIGGIAMMDWVQRGRLWLQDERGNVGMFLALMAVPVFGITGLAIDYGRAISARSQLQLAADAASLAAASRPSLVDTDRIDLAKKIFRQDRAGNADVASVEASVVEEQSGTDKIVKVTATRRINTTFAGILGLSGINLEVESKAQLGAGGGNGPACLLALEQSGNGIKINGGGTGSHLTANCGVHANSQSSSAIFGNDKGAITASSICVYGDYDRSPTYSPTPQNGCARLADPFAGLLTAPSSAGCTFNNTKVNSNRSATLNPGVHCGGIDIGSSAEVTFNPGVYVIKNGQFKIGSSAQATGDGVFFYLTGNNSRFLWTSHSEVTFKAPTTGDYKGMLIWSDNALSNAHEIGCHSQSVIQGAVYSPNTEIQIGSSGDVGASADWTVWVVKSVEMASHAHLKVMANFSGSSTPPPDGLLARLTVPSKRAVLK